MKEALATVEISVLCGWKFLNHFGIVSETPNICDTVGCELWQVILCSLLCPETDWKIRIGKQGYVFILYFHASFLTSISVSTVILRLGKV